uniref:Uncharacterized protein n=1 Tax=Arundo donax TaxID=35708 RepID=A0A0A9AN51_ARUDO
MAILICRSYGSTKEEQMMKQMYFILVTFSENWTWTWKKARS